MLYQPTRRIFHVFIASPGDLVDEREAAFEVVERLNRILGKRIGWQIELLGWEDTRPGVGRPQEIINRDVDRCELFLGLLWERWGQTTGLYDSGFFEEFCRARERRRETQKPEMWLCFKQVASERLKDPGPQLQKVLNFKREQQEERLLLYKEFRDAEQWKVLLHDWLLDYVLELHQLELGGTDSASMESSPTVSYPPALRASKAQSITEEPEDKSRAIQQATAGDSMEPSLILRSLHKLLMPGINDGKRLPEGQASPTDISATEAEGPQEMFINAVAEGDIAAIARYLLFFTSALAIRVKEIFLDGHAINSAYRHRRSIYPTRRERYLILRTIVADISETKPGWFWLRHVPERVEFALFSIALDSDRQASKPALEILTATRQLPPPLDEIEDENARQEDQEKARVEILKYLLRTNDEELRTAALNYLKAVGKASDRFWVEETLADASSSLREKMNVVLEQLEAEADPKGAWEKVLSGEIIKPKPVLEMLRAKNLNLDDEVLLSAARHEDSDVRAFAVEQLAHRGELPVTLAQELTGHSSTPLRQIAFKSLMKNGVLTDLPAIYDALEEKYDSTKTELRVRDIFAVAPRALLEKEIDWFKGIHGPTAYQALGCSYFDEVSARIRSDTRSQFEDLKQQAYARLQAYPPELRDEEVKSWRSLDGFRLGRYMAAAFEILSQHGEPEDAEFARAYLNNASRSSRERDGRVAAIRLLQRHGNSQDVPFLKDLALSGEFLVDVAAAQAAISLSPGWEGVARHLLTSRDQDIFLAALGAVWNEKPSRTKEVLEPLLREDSWVRMPVLFYFLCNLKPALLERLIDRYHNQSGYYFYNVMCWLDRALYAPEPLRTVYLKQMKQSYLPSLDVALPQWQSLAGRESKKRKVVGANKKVTKPSHS